MQTSYLSIAGMQNQILSKRLEIMVWIRLQGLQKAIESGSLVGNIKHLKLYIIMKNKIKLQNLVTIIPSNTPMFQLSLHIKHLEE